MIPRPSAVIAASAAMAVAALAVVGCGSEATEPSASEFCRYVKENEQAILNPPLGSNQEIAATLDFYELMGELAPLAITDQWQSMVTYIETSSTVVPSDPESVQRWAKQAYATELPAYEISVWVERNCGVILPVATIVPHGGSPGGDVSNITSIPPDGAQPSGGTDAPSTGG